MSPAPSADDLEGMAQAWGVLTGCNGTTTGSARTDASSMLGRHATAILQNLVGRGHRDHDLLVTHVAKGKDANHLVARQGGIETARAPLRPQGPAGALAEIAMLIQQRRTLGAYVAATRDAVGKGDRDGGTLVHPVVALMEHVSGRLGTASDIKRSTSLLLRGQAAAAKGGRGTVSISVGSVSSEWGPGRPTILRMGVRLTDTIVAGLSGRRLADLLEVRLPEHLREAYEGIVIDDAQSGLRGAARIHLTLRPSLQIPRGAGPVSDDVASVAAWNANLSARRAL